MCKSFKDHINDFIKELLPSYCHCAECDSTTCEKCKDSDFEYKVYNEYSLQYELGKYLSDNDYDVFYEKNVKEFLDEEDADSCIKKEVDLIAVKDNKKYYAIELKFPKNGQYPEQMKKFIIDMCFMKQVKKYWRKKNKDAETYCLTLVNDSKFYSNKSTAKKTLTTVRTLKTKGIYSFFRGEKNKPIYKQVIKWHHVPSKKLYYYFISMP